MSGVYTPCLECTPHVWSVHPMSGVYTPCLECTPHVWSVHPMSGVYTPCLECTPHVWSEHRSARFQDKCNWHLNYKITIMIIIVLGLEWKQWVRIGNVDLSSRPGTTAVLYRSIYKDHTGTYVDMSIYKDHTGTCVDMSIYKDHTGTCVDLCGPCKYL